MVGQLKTGGFHSVFVRHDVGLHEKCVASSDAISVWHQVMP